MGYLFIAVLAYYLLLGLSGYLLTHCTEEEQAEHARRWQPLLGWIYWLVNAPLLFTWWLWMNASRWSLSTALQPV